LFGENKIDPAEERSRATMWDVPRFAEFHNYNLIIVENVVDARHWVMFDAWIHAMRLLGYDYQCVYFNSMFAHPTPQSRDRMYIVFWKKGNKKPNLKFNPPAWCQSCEKDVNSVQSWKQGKSWGRYGQRNQYIYTCPKCGKEVHPYYYAAANAIDWSIPGERIGDRKKPLKPRTMERIEYGLKKYGNQAQWVQVDYTHSDAPYIHPVSEALGTQTARQVVGLALPFVMPNQGDKYISRSVLDPLHTQVASVQPSLIMPFLISPNNRTLRATSVNDVHPTQTGSLGSALVIPQPFLMSYYSREDASSPLNDAIPTVTAEPRHALVSPYIVEFYGWSKARQADEPLSTVMTINHHGLVMPPFFTSYYGNDQASGIDEALPTVSTVDRHALVQPEPTLSIDDCHFRMLQPHEIGRAMAFPDSYVVLGNNRDKVRQYGNAVTPPVMQMLVDRCVETLQ
jgi:DNA (cytosine-5)-methyltransferase 1